VEVSWLLLQLGAPPALSQHAERHGDDRRAGGEPPGDTGAHELAHVRSLWRRTLTWPSSKGLAQGLESVARKALKGCGLKSPLPKGRQLARLSA
jgi:hypothetical protein